MHIHQTRRAARAARQPCREGSQAAGCAGSNRAAPGPATVAPAGAIAGNPGNCRGACTGDETAAHYNLRLLEGLGSQRIRPWPWHGPVVVREHDPHRRRTDLHVIDRWCHLGTAHDAADVPDIAGAEPRFDRDQYRLLVRWLERHPNTVQPLRAD